MAVSKLIQMRIANVGCIGPNGVEIALDNIVCLVGQNNVGKSTVLRAYEAAVNMADLRPDEIHFQANGQPATVELWVHIPEGAENIDEKWKEKKGGLLLVRSKWTWAATGGKPIRTTWNPEAEEYADEGKAAGLDNVFKSRLPKPFRIGALEDPTKEHAKLLSLILDPIKIRLAGLMSDTTSALYGQFTALQTEAEKPVAEFREDLDRVQSKVNASYQSVFNTSQVRLSVSLGTLALDPGAALVKSSAVEIMEPHGASRWDQQGTGSQRALFWSMLEVRSELNRVADERKRQEKALSEKEKDLKKAIDKLPTFKKEDAKKRCEDEIQKLQTELQTLRVGTAPTGIPVDTFLPGYMLLIEEPETALHPSTIRAAKEHLYALAAESGWQVMLSTHHPVFVDPLKDHTTIVRLHRPDANEPPNVYRADEMTFTTVERENLKSLLAFDTTVAEMFFGPRVIIVEGDTEFAAFEGLMDQEGNEFPVACRPLVLRARGKATIPTLIRMLTHYKVDFTVLHDIDAPRTAKGDRVNPAYTINESICRSVVEAQKSGRQVIHRCSCPFFEEHHGMVVPAKDKPFEAWRTVRADQYVRASVENVLKELVAAPGDETVTQCFRGKIKKWAKENANSDPAYVFAD